MKKRDDGRRQLTITMAPELFEALADAAKAEDVPYTVWVRQAIRAKLEQQP